MAQENTMTLFSNGLIPIGVTDLVFVPSDKLGKEYEGNLFVGELILAFISIHSKSKSYRLVTKWFPF